MCDMGSLAHAVLARANGQARVLAAFPKATYLRAPAGGMVVLTAPGVPRGPLHIPLSELPPLASGEQVAVIEGGLLIEGTEWRSTAAPWRGIVPDRAALRAAQPLAADLLRSVPTPELLVPSTLLDATEALVRQGDLARVAGLIGGRGAGLTPVGDDILAGLLFAAWLLGDEGGRAGLRRVARLSQTNPIAAAYLDAAAGGQSIAPVHDLGGALAAGDKRAARLACAETARFGASSGDALCYGVLLGLSATMCG
jgi:Protein of unknown function (DUF2877)